MGACASVAELQSRTQLTTADSEFASRSARSAILERTTKSSPEDFLVGIAWGCSKPTTLDSSTHDQTGTWKSWNAWLNARKGKARSFKPATASTAVVE